MNLQGVKVEFFDDYIVPDAEKQKILDRIARIVSVALEERLQKENTA